MRDPCRIDRMLKRLGVLWHRYPDLRLCQLVINTAGIVDCFHLEDDEMEQRIETASDEAWRQEDLHRQIHEAGWSPCPMCRSAPGPDGDDADDE